MPGASDRARQATSIDTVVDALTRMYDELTRAVEELRQSEQRYRILCNNSNDVILLIDARSGRLTDATPSAERQYRYSRGELLAMTIHHLCSPRDAGESPALFETILRDGRAPFERQHQTRDGRLLRVGRSQQSRYEATYSGACRASGGAGFRRAIAEGGYDLARRQRAGRLGAGFCVERCIQRDGRANARRTLERLHLIVVVGGHTARCCALKSRHPHRKRVWAEAEVDRGAWFYFALGDNPR